MRSYAVHWHKPRTRLAGVCYFTARDADHAREQAAFYLGFTPTFLSVAPVG